MSILSVSGFILGVRILGLFCLCAFSFSAFGAEKIELNGSCSYFSESSTGSVYTFSSDREAEEIIQEIVDVSGLPKNFSVHAAGVDNAAAVIDGDTRYILYNQSFIREIKEETGSVWSGYSILAHEIGHHLAGHTLEAGGSRPPIELEADTYSGFVMQRLGASLQQAQLVMSLIGSERGSNTHPAKRDRLAAIANGWIRECERDARCDGEKNSPDPSSNRRLTSTRPDRFSEAVDYFDTCNSGSALGCVKLGWCYERGVRGVDMSLANAVEAYRFGCDGGNANSCNNLGRLYRKGLGVERDPVVAARLYETACEDRLATACSNLGNVLLEGDGLPKNASRAADLKAKACDLGHTDSCTP